MTNAPHLLHKSREGIKYGNGELVDAMAFDGLTDAFDGQPMGASTEGYNSRYDLTRDEQDAFAARSHQRAAAAQKNGLFVDEIVPVEIPQRRGDPIVFSEDEGIRADTTVESLRGYVRHSRKDGTITAGSASQISDGACSRRRDEQGEGRGAGLPGWPRSARTALSPARHVAARAAGERHQEGASTSEGLPPATSTLSRSTKRLRPSASCRQGVGSLRREGQPQRRGDRARPPDRYERCAVALTLAYELKRRGGGIGAAALCGGGGQGDALILRVPA